MRTSSSREADVQRLLADTVAMAARARMALEASPHRCADCQTHVLAPGRCEPCAAAHKAAHERLERLPPRYRWCRFGAPELPQRVRDRAAIEMARQACGAPTDRVVLTGAAGAGKTVLAACILAERSSGAKYCDFAFASSIDLSTARALSGLGREADLVDEAMRAGLLAIDDLGADKQLLQSAVPDVIHYRHAHMRPTIVTTGLTIDAIAQRYGDGIARRLFEGAIVIDVGGSR